MNLTPVLVCLGILLWTSQGDAETSAQLMNSIEMRTLGTRDRGDAVTAVQTIDLKISTVGSTTLSPGDGPSGGNSWVQPTAATFHGDRDWGKPKAMLHRSNRRRVNHRKGAPSRRLSKLRMRREREPRERTKERQSSFKTGRDRPIPERVDDVDSGDGA